MIVTEGYHGVLESHPVTVVGLTDSGIDAVVRRGPVLDAYWRRGRMVVHAEPQRGRRLVATDLDWARGSGPEVKGKATDLVGNWFVRIGSRRARPRDK
jgi:hypothetical protein